MSRPTARELIRQMHAEGCWTVTEIVRQLQACGYPPPGRAKAWSRRAVLRELPEPTLAELIDLVTYRAGKPPRA